MSGVFEAPYPVVLDLVGKRALVVGAGPVAARKVAGLLRAGAHVTVVAPDAVSEIAEDPDVRWHERPYECTIYPGDLLYFPKGWYHAIINVGETVFMSTFL